MKCFCFILRHLWYRFLIYAPASLTWSCSIVGEIEIYSSGFQGLRGLIKLRQGLQQMEIFCCKRPANRGIPCGAHWLRVAPPVFIGFYEFSFFNKFCLLGVQVVARSGSCLLSNKSPHSSSGQRGRGSSSLLSCKTSKGTSRGRESQKISGKNWYQWSFAAPQSSNVFLAFSGFLRFLELSLIRPKDIMFGERFISVFIEKSKADQLKEGQSVVIAESRSSTCPVALLILYLMSAQLLFDSDQYLFRPISASRNCKRLVSVNKAISYSTYRESFKTSFQGIVAGISKFSTHSATSAANSVISERNLQRHGRWASISAKNTYIKALFSW